PSCTETPLLSRGVLYFLLEAAARQVIAEPAALPARQRHSPGSWPARLRPSGHRRSARRVAPRRGRWTLWDRAHEPGRDPGALGDVEPLLADRLCVTCAPLLLERLAEPERGDRVQGRDARRWTVHPVAPPHDRRWGAI